MVSVIPSYGQTKSLNIFPGMVKDCRWKGRQISCAAIFTMQPTDRGMCCSFNKARADELFSESRFKEQVERMTNQDKNNSKEDSKLPDW